MANATKYVDNANGSDANTGDSEAQAYATIGKALDEISGGGNTIHVQAGTAYTLTSTIAFPAGLKGDTADGRNRMIGYTTTPGAADGRPIITSATNSVHLFTLNDNDYWEFHHLKFTHTATTRGNAFTGASSTSSPLWTVDCVIDGCLLANAASSLFSQWDWIATEITSGTGTHAVSALGVTSFLDCDIHDNAGDGIRTLNGLNAAIFVSRSKITGNGGIGISDVNATACFLTVTHSTIAGNAESGIKHAAKGSASVTLLLMDNVIYGNATSGGYGIENLDTQVETDALVRSIRNNAFGANTGGAYTGLSAGVGEVTLTADPFTNAAARNFTPNTTSGGGALLRNAGSGGADIGAVQHPDPVGGGGGGGISRGRLIGGI